MNDIGRKIRERLLDIGMDQRELARLAGMTEVSISRYISGKRIPNARSLLTLCAVLNVSADYLLDISGVKTRQPPAKIVKIVKPSGMYGSYRCGGCGEMVTPWDVFCRWCGVPFEKDAEGKSVCVERR